MTSIIEFLKRVNLYTKCANIKCNKYAKCIVIDNNVPAYHCGNFDCRSCRVPNCMTCPLTGGHYCKCCGTKDSDHEIANCPNKCNVTKCIHQKENGKLRCMNHIICLCHYGNCQNESVIWQKYCQLHQPRQHDGIAISVSSEALIIGTSTGVKVTKQIIPKGGIFVLEI